MMNLKELNPKKILIINTFGIGDVLFTTPLISNLKSNFPEAFIGYLGNRRTQPMLENNKNIDKVFTYERDEFKEVYKKSKPAFFKKLKNSLDEIKAEHFDVVFDFSLNRTADLLMWHLGIKHRIGFNYKNRSPLLTDKLEFDGFEKKHVVEYYLDLLKHFGLQIVTQELDMAVTEEDHLWADQFLKENGQNGRRALVGVIPGAGASWGSQAQYRRWAPENYVKLVDKMIENFPVQIILMGDKSEEGICSKIAQGKKADVLKAYGKTTIGQMAALLSRCALVILNDGGPLHIAVAVKTKTVSIFGPVDNLVYGPFGPASNHVVVKKDLACQPCYRKFRMTQCDHISCLRNLNVNDVYDRIRTML